MIDLSEILCSKILIVDDQKANVVLLEEVLKNAGYQAVSATTRPTEVCAMHLEHRYDLIMVDLQMPGMDGCAVMGKLKEFAPDPYLPVLVLTAQPAHKLRALKAGARDFVSKPFELAEVLMRVHNMLEVRFLDKQLQVQNDQLEQRVKARTAELQESYLETIFAMTRAAEFKDEDTGAHVQRISHYSRELAILLGQNSQFIENIFFSSPMHDIGKIGIPDNILHKPGGFSPAEWEVMKTHSIIGATILGDSKSACLCMGAEIALNHHERWDGGGYPHGITGEAIPLAARIMNICDVYNALRSKRPYKLPFAHDQSMSIITQGDGRTQPEHFDPTILAVFSNNSQLFCDIFERLA